MEILHELWRRLQMLFHSRQLRADLEEEMRLHVDLRTRQKAERGLAPGDARTAALRGFGNQTLLREKSQAAWGWTWLESLLRDTLYGIRGLLRSPGATLVALLSLALGIGANTAIFTLTDAVMFRLLPVKDPNRLFLLGDGRDAGISDEFGRTDLYANPVYRRIQRENHVFSSTAAVFSMTNDVHGFVDGRIEPEPLKIQLVSGTYFATLGVEPLLGRLLADSDDNSEGNHPVAIAGNRWWKRRLASDPAAVGKTIRVGGTVYSIVGVAPPEFFGTTVGVEPDLWVPLSMAQDLPPHWGGYNDNMAESLYVFGRLKPGVTAAEASTNVNLLFQQIFHQLIGSFPDNNPAHRNAAVLGQAHVPLNPLAKGLSHLRAQSSDPLRILSAVVALVLLIACANIANLLLARSTARGREFAVRQALGAARGRLLRQLFTESLVLALAGGALGVAFASFGSRMLLRMISRGPDVLPIDVSLNVRLLWFTLAITMITALLFGTAPAFRATRLELTNSLKGSHGASPGAAKSPLARALVITQVAFSLVLMVGADLFLRSFVNLSRVDSGFDKPENVLLLTTDESSAGYKPDDARLPQLHRQIEERVSALPGIVSGSFSTFTFFREGAWNNPVYLQGFDNDKSVDVKHNIVGKGYFATMGIPILAGRGFGPQDTLTSQRVAIVSQRMAQTLFPSGSPIGRHYGLSPQKTGEFEVIGVARDVKFAGLDEPAQTLDYYSWNQGAQYLGDFEVRFAGDRNSVASEVQKAIHAIDPHLPITRVESLEDRLSSSASGQRTMAQLSTFFALAAAFLSSIGIYGLMSYVVSRRAGEIGIRMALGAERAHVRWLVMRDILILIAAGIAIGIPATLALGRLVANMLYGLQPADPLSLAAATMLLFAIAVLAGFLPARRASRVDPMIALRCE